MARDTERLERLHNPDRRPQGIGCSLAGFVQSLFRALKPLPKFGINLTEWTGRFMNPALFVFEVVPDLWLMIQIERDRAVNLRQFQCRKALLNCLGRVPA